MQGRTFIAIAVAWLTLQSAWATGSAETLTVGHRGARARFPENTLPAVEHALQSGADWVEIDVHVTRDEEIVAHHDPHIMRSQCIYGDGELIFKKHLIRSMSLGEVQSFDCGTLPNLLFLFKQKRVPGARIPTLDQVFELLLDHSSKFGRNDQRILIEIKSEPENPEYSPPPTQFAHLILDKIRSFGVENQVAVQSFDRNVLIAIKQTFPAFPIGKLIEDKREDWLDSALILDADFVAPKFKLLKKDRVSLMHTLGLKVIPWTVNKKKDWKKALSLGADGIITDDPRELSEYLGR